MANQRNEKNTNKENGTMEIITNKKSKNIVELATMANTSYLKINGDIVGIIGGPKKSQQANVRCLQFIADNVVEETGKEIAARADNYTRIMANIEEADLENIIKVNNCEYALDYQRRSIWTEYGEEALKLEELYPELKDVELDKESVLGILQTEITQYAPERTEEYNIEGEPLMGTLSLISGLRALGMKSSWFNVEGKKQLFPICYCGETDKAAFDKIVSKVLTNKQNYLLVMTASANYKDKGISPDSEINIIEGVKCLIDYSTRTIWDVYGIEKLGDLENYPEIPTEAVKAMLVAKARQYIKNFEEEEFEDYNDDYYDEEDEYYEDYDY